jgi:hypothetical protein
MKKALFLFLILIPFTLSAQMNLDLNRNMRVAEKALTIITEQTGWRVYNTTMTIDSMDTNSFIQYWDYSDFDTNRTYYRAKQVVIYITLTGGASANYQPIYFYYNPVNYAGIALSENIPIKDMISEWWSNSTPYRIFIGEDLAPGQGIKISAINSGIATVTFSIQIYAGEGYDITREWETFSARDTLNGSDTLSFVFPAINIGGHHSIKIIPYTIAGTADSLLMRVLPMWNWQTTSGYWGEIPDSLNWYDWTSGTTYIPSVTDLVQPCPFIQFKVIHAGDEDTIDVQFEFGGYRK